MPLRRSMDQRGGRTEGHCPHPRAVMPPLPGALKSENSGSRAPSGVRGDGPQVIVWRTITWALGEWGLLGAWNLPPPAHLLIQVQAIPETHCQSVPPASTCGPDVWPSGPALRHVWSRRVPGRLQGPHLHLRRPSVLIKVNTEQQEASADPTTGKARSGDCAPSHWEGRIRVPIIWGPFAGNWLLPAARVRLPNPGLRSEQEIP